MGIICLFEQINYECLRYYVAFPLEGTPCRDCFLAFSRLNFHSSLLERTAVRDHEVVADGRFGFRHITELTVTNVARRFDFWRRCVCKRSRGQRFSSSVCVLLYGVGAKMHILATFATGWTFCPESCRTVVQETKAEQ